MSEHERLTLSLRKPTNIEPGGQRLVRGHWDLLVWFAQGERILPEDELAALLAKYRAEVAA